MLFILFFFFLLYESRILFVFFFSSRRRHTRWNCDWSSDGALPIYSARHVHRRLASDPRGRRFSCRPWRRRVRGKTIGWRRLPGCSKRVRRRFASVMIHRMFSEKAAASANAVFLLGLWRHTTEYEASGRING